MKRLFVIALLVLIGHFAHAQSFGITLGGRLEAVPNALGTRGDISAIPMVGLELGTFVRIGDVSIGVRVSFSSVFVFVWHGQADVYGGYTFADGTFVYIGLGYGFVNTLFPSGRFNNQDTHALLGFRLAGGFFAEFTPGVAYGTACNYGPPPTPANAVVRPQTPTAYECNNVRAWVVGVNLGFVWVLG